MKPGGTQTAQIMMMKAPKAHLHDALLRKSAAILGPAKTVAIVGVL